MSLAMAAQVFEQNRTRTPAVRILETKFLPQHSHGTSGFERRPSARQGIEQYNPNVRFSRGRTSKAAPQIVQVRGTVVRATLPPGQVVIVLFSSFVWETFRVREATVRSGFAARLYRSGWRRNAPVPHRRQHLAVV